MIMTNTTETTAGRNFLTLAEFVGTKVEVPDICEAIGFADDGGVRGGFVYDQCAYIEHDQDPATGKPNGEFYLCIERSTWNDPDLAKLERILWAEHYLFDTAADVALSPDDGTLDDFIRAICEVYGTGVDGDVFGVLFSEVGRTWSPAEARGIIASAITADAAVLRDRLDAIAANQRVAAMANAAAGVGVQSGGVGVQSKAGTLALTEAELTNLITACKTSTMRTGSTDWQGMLDAIATKLYAARDALDAKAVQ